MIPNDLAARLRLLAETIVRPVAPAHEIPAELPEFSAGQRFTARIEAALPDGTFRALVAGRSLTLSLPESAQPGDTLELVVAERTPRLIVAQRPPEAAPQQEEAATLSRTGQLISTLLSGAQGTAQTAAPRRAAPLLPQPPASAAPLAPLLQRAIAESGLFYEAHQAQWVAGRYPLEALVREPQGRLPRGAVGTGSRGEGAAPTGAAPTGAAPAEGAPAESAATRTQAGSERPALLPPELQPLVQQQLDTAATGRILWHGEIWPGQTADWEIAEEPPRREGAAEEEPPQWRTTLRLDLPQLGEVSAALLLTPAGVSLAMTAAESAAGTLRAGQEDLSAALAAAGLPLLTLTVESHEPA